MLRFSRCLLALFTLTVLRVATSASAKDLEPSEEAKLFYKENATLLDNVLATTKPPAKPNDSAATIIHECLVKVGPTGKRIRVWHLVYKALDDSGTKSISSSTIGFNKRTQHIGVLEAFSRQPDGTVQPVKADAILVQSPQRSADYSLYDDEAELKVIFPNVKVGTMVSLSVATEDLSAKIEGEYCDWSTWRSTWPSSFQRFAVLAAKPISDKLHWDTLGAGVPDVEKKSLPDGLTLFDWTAKERVGTKHEVGQQSTDQIGPVVRVSTMTDWAAISTWYHTLTKGTDTIGEKLRKQTDQLLEGAKDREEIIQRLHSKIANQVRYVGLEFGDSDYKPHACDDVWENQYGDCKDKANLLASLLRSRGIMAHLVLINTEDTGLVDLRSPSYQAFTHAIVAIPDDKGNFRFCDPTIPQSVPGLLGPGTTGRDAFVITNDGYTWAKTPYQPAGGFTYRFEMKLSLTGEYSGWFHVDSFGYYGTYEIERFAKLDQPDTRKRMTDRIRSFYPAANVIDVKKEVTDPEHHRVSAYFTIPPNQTGDSSSLSIPFPTSSYLYDDLGDSDERTSTMYTYEDDNRAIAEITLPENYKPVKLPTPIAIDEPFFEGGASWTYADGKLTSDLRLRLKTRLIAPKEFKRLYQASQTLKAWTTPSLQISSDSGNAEASTTQEIDFPMMPTGDGQIDLLDNRYPDTGNREMRRAAIERCLKYYSSDKKIVYRAAARLASLEWDEDKNEEALERISKLNRAYSADVEAETLAWGLVTEALILRDLNRADDSNTILRRVAEMKDVTEWRRALACYHLLHQNLNKPNKDLYDLAFRIADLPGSANNDFEPKFAEFLATNNRLADWQTHYAKLVTSHGELLPELSLAIANAIPKWKSARARGNVPELLLVIEKANPNASEALQKALLTAKNRVLTRNAVDAFKAWKKLPENKPWLQAIDALPEIKNLKLADAALKKSDDKNDSVAGFTVALKSIVLAEDSDEFSYRLWHAAAYAEWVERAKPDAIRPEVLAKFLDILETLPDDDEYFFEAGFLRAKSFTKKNDFVSEQRILRQMVNHPKAGGRFVSPAAFKLGQSLIRQGKRKEACEAFKLAEAHTVDFTKAAECVFNNLALQLDEGNTEEVQRLLKVLRTASEATIKSTAVESQLREMLLVSTLPEGKTYWSAATEWWAKDWKEFSALTKKPAEDEFPLQHNGLHTSATGLSSDFKTAIDKNAPMDAWQYAAGLASAARWEPTYSLELALLQTHLKGVEPSTVNAFRELNIKLLKHASRLKFANQDRSLLFLSALLFDSGHLKESAETLDTLFALEKVRPVVVCAGHRIEAMVLQRNKADLSPVISHLEKDLETLQQFDEREVTVTALADLYSATKQPVKERLLLERETGANSHLKSADSVNRLKTRLSGLQNASGLTDSVKEIVKQAAFPWYSTATPQNIGDPDYTALAFRSPDLSSGNLATYVKFNLLYAQDETVPAERRVAALHSAVRTLLLQSPAAAVNGRLMTAVLASQEIPTTTKTDLLWMAVFSSALRNDPQQVEALLKTPDGQKLVQDPHIQLLKEFSTLDRLSAQACSESLQRLKTTSIDITSYYLLLALSNDLYQLGELEACESLLEDLPNWNIANDAVGPVASFKLDFAAQVRTLRRNRPVDDLLTTAISERCAPLPETLTKGLKEWKYSQPLPYLTPREWNDLQLACVKRHFQRDVNYPRWSEILLSLQQTENDRAFVRSLLPRCLATASDDRAYMYCFAIFSEALDSDDPVSAEAFRSAFAPLAKRETNPLLHWGFSYWEALMKTRLSQSTEFSSLMPGCDPDLAEPTRRLFKLQNIAITGNTQTMAKLLQETPPSVLFSDQNLRPLIPALRATGRAEELATATGRGKEYLSKLVANSWIDGNGSSMLSAMETALVLDESSPLPYPWIEYAGQNLGSPFDRFRFNLARAMIGKDWPAMETESERAIAFKPTYYAFYWFRGYALFKLNRKEEAKEALRVYTKYAKNELHYAEAMRMLEL